MDEPQTTNEPYDPSAITRPVPQLLKYYLLVSILTLVAMPIVFVVHYIKYRTLKFRFDDKGIAMSWGYVFRKEIYLTYRRIQDIQVTKNLFHRWLGLASVSIQTASGSSGAEMTLEGLPEPKKMRDYLYSKMRGARGEIEETEVEETAKPVEQDEALVLLKEIRDELVARRKTQEGPAS
ncbi:MAG: PH domain-containing protein [Planctomycetota bacterium]|nr:PH domain-containing protein [Planctomycetota bacterium]